MKKFTFILALVATLLPTFAQAQELSDEEIAALSNVKCKDYYLAPANKNWFVQFGIGFNYASFESWQDQVTGKSRYLALNYGIGVGHWFSPYLALRLAAQGGALHWGVKSFPDGREMSDAKYANLNVDLMWDMFNTFGGINTKRIFSIYPFVGLGAAYTWDIETPDGVNGMVPVSQKEPTKYRNNAWTLPISAGLKLNLRLSKYIDFNIEGRMQAIGDNFNGCVYGRPLDLNLTVFAGLTFNIGGRDFPTANPCEYLGYINDLNKKVNGLRGDIDDANKRLQACEDQLPCPEPVQPDCRVIEPQYVAAVRFTINSDKVSNLEQTHIYNVAQYLKSHPDQMVAISGYADKNTGNEKINERIAAKRATAVKNTLLSYGVSEDQMTVESFGDKVQPFDLENDWNRVVVFELRKK